VTRGLGESLKVWLDAVRSMIEEAAMTAAIEVVRKDLSVVELRVMAAREEDAAAARRMLAIALVVEGADRTTAARTCGMERQTLRDWVHRYNAHGLAGLYDRKAPGARPKLSVPQLAVLAALVEAGPDPKVHKVVRWRRCDLRDELKRRLGVEVRERTVGTYLAKLGYRRLSVRPQHPTSDAEDQEAYKKTSPRRSLRRSPTMSGASP
jgi:transposase